MVSYVLVFLLLLLFLVGLLSIVPNVTSRFHVGILYGGLIFLVCACLGTICLYPLSPLFVLNWWRLVALSALVARVFLKLF
jgi:hypothetical protein